MKTYNVDSTTTPSDIISSLPDKAARIQALKDAQKDFRRIVEDFVKEHPGRIQIVPGKEDLWAAQALQIQADPVVAQKLSKVPGIGTVQEPVKLAPENAHRRQRPPAP